MSSDVSIRVSGLCKSFPVYDKPHHRLMQMFAAGDAKRRWYREFHALSNIDFEVHRGETVGIVGRNGSGKSTLLQLICGTLAPTLGNVEINGRIAALLELGAGFNPEFTGRENVFLNGTLLGLTRMEIEARFDEIVAFADIGDFIDQPVKSYSSGMYIRLAFAVAINVTPDILIVDEALSVGDEAFQRKCFARIERIRNDGATVLFVSHSAGTVLELCNRAILLDRGELLAIGTPKRVVSHYQKLLYAPDSVAKGIRDKYRRELLEQSGTRAGNVRSDAANIAVQRPEDMPGEDIPDAYFDPGLRSQSELRFESRGGRVVDPHLETPGGQRVNVVRSGAEYVFVYSAEFDKLSAAVRFGMLIKSVSGLELGGAVTSQPLDAIDFVQAGTSVTVRFRFRCLLAPGTYFMNAGIRGRVGEEETFLDRVIDAVLFRVLPDPGRLATGYVDFGVQSQLTLEGEVHD
ncbi:lipopolysaccharide transport system ATP-binding protein [Dyella jiangningensis]|uniref:ABC transporter ATP-binding protein n=1 Tax=Dyella sp. AtDHG13 TaxID=1938897 RepID=UPI000887E1AE|nr:ABC transporter ATP-binding protein [Dyella sp. AtDHG13]PXV57261.1 lipopolysaccharide transport system ATP-binding protein [Dyella sp. AtDHG13]SDK37431.1 lipopolysaccharide transport system ATP-binding protein [Dyella jiangningensis]